MAAKPSKNEPTTQTDDGSSTSTWIIIMSVVLGVILAVGGVIVFIIIWQRKRTVKSSTNYKQFSANCIDRFNITRGLYPPDSTSSLSESADLPFESLSLGNKSTSTAVLRSVSDSVRCPEPSENLQVEYEDRSMNLVDPMIENSKMTQLIQDILQDAQSISIDDTTTRLTEAPQITKVITYGTSDTITIVQSDEMESMQSSSLASNGSIAKKITWKLAKFLKRERPREDVLGLSPAKSLLIKMIEHGPYEYPFELSLLKAMLIDAAAMLRAESSLLEIDVPVIVYGDIHGQYSDLLRWLNLHGWPNQRRCVFLGDFVDRGSHGMEVFAIIMCLKLVFYRNVHVIRGNHEEESLNKAYSFFNEIKARYPNDDLYTYYRECFNYLPLAVVIGERILAMHGGLSPKLNSLDDIREIERPINGFKNDTIACDLVWSDPDTNMKSGLYKPNFERDPKFGVGQLFSMEAVNKVCNELQIDMIIRGHQAPLYGYACWADSRLVTLFSAPGYKGRIPQNINMGATLEIQPNGQIIVYQLQVSRQFRNMRILDMERRNYATSASVLVGC